MSHHKTFMRHFLASLNIWRFISFTSYHKIEDLPSSFHRKYCKNMFQQLHSFNDHGALRRLFNLFPFTSLATSELQINDVEKYQSILLFTLLVHYLFSLQYPAMTPKYYSPMQLNYFSPSEDNYFPRSMMLGERADTD